MPKRHRKKTRNDFSFWVGEVLKVRWEDTSGADEATLKEVDTALFFNSYGLCVSETEKALIVCSMSPTDPKDKQLRHVVRIPKRCIDEIVILEETQHETTEFI